MGNHNIRKSSLIKKQPWSSSTAPQDFSGWKLKNHGISNVYMAKSPQGPVGHRSQVYHVQLRGAVAIDFRDSAQLSSFVGKKKSSSMAQFFIGSHNDSKVHHTKETRTMMGLYHQMISNSSLLTVPWLKL